jgi:tetratricopeptide (TPR) repeat protein
VEGALRKLIAEQPRSVHARCYLGELLLWLGRYDDAWRQFVEARRIRHARWTAIGMLAVLVLTRRYAAARGMAIYARHGFRHIAGGTLPAYRGSLRRRMGDFDGAIEDLGAAIAAKPTRLGVRLELCLALRAAGRSVAADEHTTILVQHGAALLADAAGRLGLDWCADRRLLITDEVLEEALRAMRGNRSSQIATWLDGSGTLRVLEPRALIESEARGALSDLR